MQPYGQALIRAKRPAALFSLFLIGATLWPIRENGRQEPKDDFPLSYFPMFSEKRPEVVRLTYLVGIDAAGNRHCLPHRFAGTGGMNQVRKQLRNSVRNGEADRVCQTVAAKIARAEKRPFSEITTVQVVTGSYRLADYFTGDKTPSAERVHASCTVERGGT